MSIMNRTKYLLENEAQNLNTCLERMKDKNPRDCNILWLLLHTGARATEILNIKYSDLNTTEQTVLIRGIKNSNDREIPLPSWLFERLVAGARAEGEAQSEARIFPISYARLYQIWDLYKPVKKKIHALRHTFAIRLYARTKDLRLCKTALGHKSITSTMVYADYLYTQEELKKLILVTA